MHHRDTNPHNHGCNNAASAMASQQSPPPAHTRTHTDRTDNSRWFSSLYSSASAKAARTQEGTACSSPSTAWFQSSASTASISSLYRTDTAYLQAVRQYGRKGGVEGGVGGRGLEGGVEGARSGGREGGREGRRDIGQRERRAHS